MDIEQRVDKIEKNIIDIKKLLTKIWTFQIEEAKSVNERFELATAYDEKLLLDLTTEFNKIKSNLSTTDFSK